jgi:hypothetical protein
METGCIQTLVKKNSLELFKIQENEKNSWCTKSKEKNIGHCRLGMVEAIVIEIR